MSADGLSGVMTVTVVIGAGILSACSGASSPRSASAGDGLNNIAAAFDPKLAAQRNYDRSLAAYQNCYAANRSNPEACEAQKQMLEADTKLLAEALRAGQ